MGAAAYNRGSAVIRRQADEQVKGIQPHEPYYLERDIKPLRDRLAATEAELERCKRALASSRAMLAVERDNRATERDLQDARVKEYWGLAMKHKRSWEKASAMIRACLTPEQVEEYRKERDAVAHQKRAR